MSLYTDSVSTPSACPFFSPVPSDMPSPSITRVHSRSPSSSPCLPLPPIYRAIGPMLAVLNAADDTLPDHLRPTPDPTLPDTYPPPAPGSYADGSSDAHPYAPSSYNYAPLSAPLSYAPSSYTYPSHSVPDTYTLPHFASSSPIPSPSLSSSVSSSPPYMYIAPRPAWLSSAALAGYTTTVPAPVSRSYPVAAFSCRQSPRSTYYTDYDYVTDDEMFFDSNAPTSSETIESTTSDPFVEPSYDRRPARFSMFHDNPPPYEFRHDTEMTPVKPSRLASPGPSPRTLAICEKYNIILKPGQKRIVPFSLCPPKAERAAWLAKMRANRQASDEIMEAFQERQRRATRFRRPIIAVPPPPPPPFIRSAAPSPEPLPLPCSHPVAGDFDPDEAFVAEEDIEYFGDIDTDSFDSSRSSLTSPAASQSGYSHGIFPPSSSCSLPESEVDGVPSSLFSETPGLESCIVSSSPTVFSRPPDPPIAAINPPATPLTAAPRGFFARCKAVWSRIVDCAKECFYLMTS